MKYDLRVSRSELVDGLKKLSKLVKRKTKGEALFNFESGNLVISLDGISIESPAEGEFRGLVRIPGAKALTLSKILPSENPLRIAHDGERLYVGTFSMPCVWHDGEPKTIQVPTDAPIVDLLALRLKHSDDVIFKSGLSQAVGGAEATRKYLERKAAGVLQPFGVTSKEIHTLVENMIRRAAGMSPTREERRPPTFAELAAQAIESHRELHAAGKCRREDHERFMEKLAKWM